MDEGRFKKKKGIGKLWLKLGDPKEYKKYKAEWYIHNISGKLGGFRDRYELLTPSSIIEKAGKAGRLNLVHSGNAGDIIYALPTVREIAALTGVPVNLFFKLGKPLDILSHYHHPLGNVMLNQAMAGMLAPLMDDQPYISTCGVIEKEPVDIDLDDFRQTGLSFDRGNIAEWYNYVTGLKPVLSEKWITAVPETEFSETIIVARSSRYNNPAIDYSFLEKFKSVAFIGVKTELEAMKQFVPGIRWLQVNDFRQMAAIIAGCRLFIGNQSFPYAVAEGLKIPRLLETAIDAPNVLPEGGKCYGFYFQEHLEWYVNEWA